jgi:type I restriction enzyme M protein
LLKDIEKKEKEQKDINKKIKQINDNLVKAVEEKRNSISEEEAKELILDKIYQTAKQHLERYLNAEKRELIKIFENLWDKYKVSLKELEAERDLEVKKLNEFLEKLGYVT